MQQKDKSDEEVAHAINQKLGDTPGISYSEIAARAYDCGRTELAIKVSWPGPWRVRLGGGMAGGGHTWWLCTDSPSAACSCWSMSHALGSRSRCC